MARKPDRPGSQRLLGVHIRRLMIYLRMITRPHPVNIYTVVVAENNDHAEQQVVVEGADGSPFLKISILVTVYMQERHIVEHTVNGVDWHSYPEDGYSWVQFRLDRIVKDSGIPS